MACLGRCGESGEDIVYTVRRDEAREMSVANGVQNEAHLPQISSDDVADAPDASLPARGEIEATPTSIANFSR